VLCAGAVVTGAAQADEECEADRQHPDETHKPTRNAHFSPFWVDAVTLEHDVARVLLW